MKSVRPWVCGALLALTAAPAVADLSEGEVRVAVLTDMRGIYSDIAGQGAVVAAEMAVEDLARAHPDLAEQVRLIVRDHESDGAIAERLGYQLVEEEKVDVFTEMVSSSTALPLQRIARDNGVVTLHSGAAASDLTGKECSPTGVHWAYDTYSLVKGTVGAMTAEGARNWFLLSADYAFGHNLEKDAQAAIDGFGGSVAGTTRHPFKGSDFSAYLLQAQASGADVVALNNAGGDTKRSIRQAYELGLGQGQDLAAMLMFITDIRSLGLYVSSGLKLTTGFYWNYDDQTRAWSERFYQRTGAMPTMVQASVYSSLMHYFKAIAAAGTDEGTAVVAKMRELPVNDFFARNGRVRADGRMVHDMYLVEVKKPSETEGAWDYFRVLKTIPGDDAFRPLEEGGCPSI